MPYNGIRLRFNNAVWLYCNLYLRIFTTHFSTGELCPLASLKIAMAKETVWSYLFIFW